VSDPGWPRPRKRFNPTDRSAGVAYQAFARDPAKDQMLPDLWVLDPSSWLTFEIEKSQRAFHERLCAVCGEPMGGYILLGAYQDPAHRETSGPGCHPRCMVMAVQFCPHFKNPPDDQVVCFRYDGGGDGTWPFKEYGPMMEGDADWRDEEGPYSMGSVNVSAAATPVTRAELKRLAKSDPLGILMA
jgi:hypothetical protein